MRRLRNYMFNAFCTLAGFGLVGGLYYFTYDSVIKHQGGVEEIERKKEKNVKEGMKLIKETWHDSLKIARGRDGKLTGGDLENLLRQIGARDVPHINEDFNVEYLFSSSSHELGRVAVLMNNNEIANFSQEQVSRYLEKHKKP